MANPLEVGSVSPAPPNPDAGSNALQQGAPQQQQQAPPSPPDHIQTVSAMRHFDAIRDELSILLKNPSLGKSSIKPAVIDGVTSLVSQRIISPAQAVIQLSQVPEDPIQQRKFLQQQMMQTVQAEHTIIAHHATGFAGGGPEPTPSADNHMDTMAGLHTQYSQK